MDAVKLFSSTSKMLMRKSNKTDRDQGQPLARSLSRNTAQTTVKIRLEESRTFIGTPRGSAGELFPAGKVSTVQTKTKANKKDKNSLEKTTKIKKKDKKKKEIPKKDKDAKSREKDSRTLADRLNDIKYGAANIKKTSGKTKQDKKVAIHKDQNPKMLLKKKLTLEDDDFGFNFMPDQRSPKNYPGSPNEDIIIQNQLVIQRLKKCLDSRPLRQLNDSKMKKSFKGDLVSKIKSQADKLARRASKELEHGSSPAVEDLMTESHRELVTRSKRAKDTALEIALEKLKTELSVSTDKRSTTNHSPVKLAKDRVRTNPRDISGKQSPQPRLSRTRKLPAQTTSKKDNNKSHEKKPRATADAQALRFSQNLKQSKTKHSKPADYLLDQIKDGKEEKEKKQKGITFFHTLSNFRSSEICKFKLASKAAQDSQRPRSSAWMLNEGPVVASLSEECIKTLELRLASSSFISKSQIQEKTDREFESRPDFVDRHPPIPIVEMADLGTVLYRTKTDLNLEASEPNNHASKFNDLKKTEGKVNKSGGKKCKPKALIEDCMEDIPNLPLETSVGTPVKESTPKPRMKPLIINRGTAGIYSTSTFY